MPGDSPISEWLRRNDPNYKPPASDSGRFDPPCKRDSQERVGSTPTAGSIDAQERELIFRERAAIREYDGGLPRPEAERLARQDTGRIVAQLEEARV